MKQFRLYTRLAANKCTMANISVYICAIQAALHKLYAFNVAMIYFAMSYLHRMQTLKHLSQLLLHYMIDIEAVYDLLMDQKFTVGALQKIMNGRLKAIVDTRVALFIQSIFVDLSNFHGHAKSKQECYENTFFICIFIFLLGSLII